MTRSTLPRPRLVAALPRYPRVLTGAVVTVTMGLASACGGAGDPYDAPHWDAGPPGDAGAGGAGGADGTQP